MEEVDYIIVGDGYAAMFFAHRLIKVGKSFKLFSDGKKSASQVSSGIINPVVLKKFTTFWKAQEQINELKSTLNEIQKYTGENYLINEPIHRIFHDENEKKLWQKKAESEELKNFLSTDFTLLEDLKNEHGAGLVLQSARLDVSGFFSGMKLFLTENHYLVPTNFDYSLLENHRYQNFNFKHIVFCEGMGVKNNPYFSEIPVLTNKGHQLNISFGENYLSSKTVKKKHFLFPNGPDSYYYGGTYDREDDCLEVNPSAIDQLKKGLEEVYSQNYSVRSADFGFRPTVKDRRPILGSHKNYENYFVFNGMGARGILNAVYFSKALYDNIENGNLLPVEVDLKRFE